MNFYTLSDKSIEDEIGRRIKALRLRKNITQKELAEATTLSLNTIKALESGSGKLSTVIAVLRELGALDQIDSFIPEPSVSPLQLAKMHGRQRERASGRRRKQPAEDDAEW
jgi:transcriptional regulator with XRE-family HTH domain